MQIEFHGGSWACGALCATVYFGLLSPWFALLTPVFIVRLPGLTPLWKWRSK